ncbi:MAG: hypothetical protein N3D11_03705 [Candidatus Sumerlaeia bacterium]|nr:hypothetical protein [Candidatus Sumerlaeia bacterium]
MNGGKPELGYTAASRGAQLEAEIKKRVLWQLLSSPLTLGPVLVGATVLAALWTFGLRSGVAAFGGIAAILAGIGVFFTRLFLSSEALIRKTLARIQKEAREQHEKALDVLEKELRATADDRRDETCLRDLRALMKAFEESRQWSETLNPRLTFDILGGVGQLFDSCVRSLRKALELWRTAERMSTREARVPILEQRRRIIEDVQKSVTQLGHLLAGVQSLDADSEAGDSELARIRAELDQSLEVARRVEQRMKSLDSELGTAPVRTARNGTEKET